MFLFTYIAMSSSDICLHNVQTTIRNGYKILIDYGISHSFIHLLNADRPSIREAPTLVYGRTYDRSANSPQLVYGLMIDP